MANDDHRPQRRVVRAFTVLDRVPLDPSTIYRMEKRGEFQQRVQLGGNSCGWYEHELNEWFDSRRRGPVERPESFTSKTRRRTKTGAGS